MTEGETREIDGEKIREIFADALSRVLLKTKVLHILSDLQRNLDVLDIEGLSKLWKEAEFAALKQNDTGLITPLGGKSQQNQISNPTISDWANILDIYIPSTRENLNLDIQTPIA